MAAFEQRPGPGTFEARVLQRFAERGRGSRAADTALTRGALPPPPQPSQLPPAAPPTRALRPPAARSARAQPRETRRQPPAGHEYESRSAPSSQRLRAGLSSSSESSDSDGCLDQLEDHAGQQLDERGNQPYQSLSFPDTERWSANPHKGHVAFTTPARSVHPLHLAGSPVTREQTEHLGMHPWEVRDYYASSRLSSLRAGGSASTSLASKLSTTARHRLERGYRQEEDSSDSDETASSDEEAPDTALDDAFSWSRFKRFFTMDSSVKLCSKRELRQCLRSRRQAVRWGLGMLLVLQVVGMSMALGLMDRGEKLPEDLHELPEKYWAAAGLGYTPSEIEKRLPPRMPTDLPAGDATAATSESEEAWPVP